MSGIDDDESCLAHLIADVFNEPLIYEKHEWNGVYSM